MFSNQSGMTTTKLSFGMIPRIPLLDAVDGIIKVIDTPAGRKRNFEKSNILSGFCP